MSAWESNARDERFDIEAGTPETSERGEPPAPRLVVVSAAISPGLVGVASISLAPPTSESGVCRCGACLALPGDIRWLE
jgi:hypothetical protein